MFLACVQVHFYSLSVRLLKKRFGEDLVWFAAVPRLHRSWRDECEFVSFLCFHVGSLLSEDDP